MDRCEKVMSAPRLVHSPMKVPLLAHRRASARTSRHVTVALDDAAQQDRQFHFKLPNWRILRRHDH
eukprot:6192678-Pleurochrysis_carterae.AAC.4